MKNNRNFVLSSTVIEGRELTNLEKFLLKIFPGTKLVCKNCNNNIDPKLQFCPKCGTKL
ncbi:MAG: hypothetical protein UR25_C0004G0059 [Candidatus Nomurabacteria bacterium GW2011_GWE1_32_28]|uniref:Zinc-ribbon domain-containing protein n=1 Tax=Candidatus Nomurabacteria bacterium GW2011_GWF1_31_48 TaxID=1618767 RepID=A0A0F9YEU7_9BACT|nr:MAG: hypothetical protein UR10_C0004G0059 [Candidatus Nomurabacteria bacterium GW2011_GWF2_30_133]KKP28593.1 MAG: hypothetical protein UR18_C0002G0005 [Candidatus Nomurabacteria bacterium GW2011_GWE2_31_40]KKP30169.1 MAG: hypothetical protein UR19_C0003G0005 [Candidatus Nomurabacteria bacterium GW2011_GWF1_31_48]KKP34695.1 MAG: hypothetical protein UR25_C0004G0059 [Candidatus Nomurabacteria bacterium GW2011_GWE1_32_28]HAS80846.1 hypothetical protein [Candidatus Nomurabacteria bacterium]